MVTKEKNIKKIYIHFRVLILFSSVNLHSVRYEILSSPVRLHIFNTIPSNVYKYSMKRRGETTFPDICSTPYKPNNNFAYAFKLL